MAAGPDPGFGPGWRSSSPLVAVAAGYGITRVHDYAAGRAELQVLLGQLETATRHQSALEWQAIAQQRLSPELSEKQREVDAAAHRLAGALAAAGRHYGAVAELATRRADLGTQVILLVAASIIGALVWRFQRAKSQTAELFAYQAHHDSLTALPNRELLVQQLQRELARAARRNEAVVLLWLDLDDFKVVNDSLGHHAGDQLLLAVGERLRACAPACAPATSRPAWAATSSPCSWPT